MKNFLDKLLDEEWGLVLAGGGGKGAFQVGVWQVLIQTGLFDRVRAISGSSVGALNLSLFAYNDYKLAHYIWSNIKTSQFLEPDLKLGNGLFKRDGLIELIGNYINLETVSECDIDLYITATKCNESGKDCEKIEYFKINGKDADEILSILLASSALPFVYDHVDVDGAIYRDGGLHDNLPIKPIYDAGFRNIIIIPLSEVVEIDIARYPLVNFLTKKKTKNLGGLISGTLDFSQEGSRERILQGVNDAASIFLNL